MASNILIVGCGDLGTALGHRLASVGHRVTGVRRSATPIGGGIQSLAADVALPASLAPLAELRPDILIYSVAASAQTDDAYRLQYVEGLKNTLNVLAPLECVRHAFFVSSTRPYGQTTEAWLDESVPAQPGDFGGERLLEAEALLAEAPIPGTVLRLSGIYGPDRTRMLKLAQTPQLWPQQNSWTNRIHRDDAADFMVFLIQRLLTGETLARQYIVTDSAPAPQHEVLGWIARQLDVIQIPPAPKPQGGKRLSNARMLHTGFELRYPSYREGYAHELHDFLASGQPK